MYQVFINAYADPLASSVLGRKMLNEKKCFGYWCGWRITSCGT